MHPLRAVLLDMDGTISDSGQGIINGIKYALSQIDFPVSDDHDWGRYLGPPLRDALMDFHGFPEDRAQETVDLYLEYYRTQGMYENAMYPGVEALVETLHDRGMPLAVATSKRKFLAEDILDHFGIRDRFLAVGGANPDGTSGRKHEVIKRTLDDLGISGADNRRVVMVGDREHDIHGARVLGLHTIGVRWGYAEPGELEAAGADVVVDTVAELASVLISP